MAVEFKIDTKGLEEFAQALKLYPKEMRKPVSRYLRDEVYNFKKFAVDILEGTYTIRDRKFVEGQGEGQAWALEVPNQNAPVNEQRGVISSRRLEDSKGRFSGWEEELTGAPRVLRKNRGKYHRGIGPNAREGGNMEGKVLGKYRLRPDRFAADGHNSDYIPDRRKYPELSMRQFIAMIAKSDGAGRSKRAKHFKEKDYALGKNKVFIMGGPEAPLGFYALQDGKVRRMQTFHEEPVESKMKFDWQSSAIEETENKFSPGYIWEKYIAPAVNAMWEK
jgi:hypothetical protein